MNTIRGLCITAVLLVSGLSAPAQQLPWKGSLENLDEFQSVLDLSDEDTARRFLISSLSDPSIQLESVAIHAYTHEEACQDSFIWRRLANKYGALRLSIMKVNEGAIQKEWFNELDDACRSNITLGVEDLCMPNGNGSDGESGCGIARALIEVVDGIDGSVDGDENIHFIYTTAPLPHAEPLAEIRGQCDLGTGSSGRAAGNSACDRKLSLR